MKILKSASLLAGAIVAIAMGAALGQLLYESYVRWVVIMATWG